MARGPLRSRRVAAVPALVLLLAAVVTHVALGAVATASLLVLSVVAAREASRERVPLPSAVPPARAVVAWNPRSGGGKAPAAHCDEEERGRGMPAAPTLRLLHVARTGRAGTARPA